jgi:hypothetical protein
MDNERHCLLGLADDLLPILHNRTTLVPSSLKLLLGPTCLNFITGSRFGSRLFQHRLYTHPRHKNKQVLRFERHAKSLSQTIVTCTSKNLVPVMGRKQRRDAK